METAPELQHVGGHWQLHQGEWANLSSEAEADDLFSHLLCQGWDAAYHGGAAFGEEVSHVEIEGFLGSCSSFVISPLAGHSRSSPLSFEGLCRHVLLDFLDTWHWRTKTSSARRLDIHLVLSLKFLLFDLSLNHTNRNRIFS